MIRLWWMPALVALALGVLAGGMVAGRSGALISLSVAATIPPTVALIALGTRRRRRAVLVPSQRAARRDGWASFWQIGSELGWAKVSPRHFDGAPRRMLQRVAAAALDVRAGVDFYAAADRGRARDLIGADLWPLIDPQRESSTDSARPGIDPATIDRLLNRLEQI